MKRKLLPMWVCLLVTSHLLLAQQGEKAVPSPAAIARAEEASRRFIDQLHQSRSLRTAVKQFSIDGTMRPLCSNVSIYVHPRPTADEEERACLALSNFLLTLVWLPMTQVALRSSETESKSALRHYMEHLPDLALHDLKSGNDAVALIERGSLTRTEWSAAVDHLEKATISLEQQIEPDAFNSSTYRANADLERSHHLPVTDVAQGPKGPEPIVRIQHDDLHVAWADVNGSAKILWVSLGLVD